MSLPIHLLSKSHCYFQKQSHLVNLISQPILPHPVPSYPISPVPSHSFSFKKTFQVDIFKDNLISLISFLIVFCPILYHPAPSCTIPPHPVPSRPILFKGNLAHVCITRLANWQTWWSGASAAMKIKFYDIATSSCIFHGYLKNEPESSVTMTGGCPFENSFEVRNKYS
jgi:hypothetical protein